MGCGMQQGLTLGCQIRFEVITSGSNKNPLCNLSNKWDEILKVQGGYVLKGLEGPEGQRVTSRNKRSKSLRFEVKSKIRSEKILEPEQKSKRWINKRENLIPYSIAFGLPTNKTLCYSFDQYLFYYIPSHYIIFCDQAFFVHAEHSPQVNQWCFIYRLLG